VPLVDHDAVGVLVHVELRGPREVLVVGEAVFDIGRQHRE
jgi:hypothetical protein